MKTTASDVLIDAIHDWGVDVVFGLPGDGINGIMEALRTRSDKIRFIQVRHEEAAAFMACAYAKYTGKLGVCQATASTESWRRCARAATRSGLYRCGMKRPRRSWRAHTRSIRGSWASAWLLPDPAGFIC